MDGCLSTSTIGIERRPRVSPRRGHPVTRHHHAQGGPVNLPLFQHTVPGARHRPRLSNHDITPATRVSERTPVQKRVADRRRADGYTHGIAARP